MLRLVYESAGNSDWKNVNKYLPAACDKALGALSRTHWNSVAHTREAQSASVSARVGVDTISRSIETMANGVRSATQAMRFD
jgi:hypothetical protein